MEEIEKRVWENFLQGIRQFKMVENGDKIAVGISGGKDSLLLISLLKKLKDSSDEVWL